MGRVLKKTQSKTTEVHKNVKAIKLVDNVTCSVIDSTVDEESKYNDEGPTSKAKDNAKLPEAYNMNHKRRGVAIILNHIHFRKRGVRTGAERDSENFAKTLLKIGFDVRVYIDPSLAEIFTALDTTAAEDHTDADCLVVAVMTHGESGYLHAAESLYSIDVLWNAFSSGRCPTLAGKPKLFFVQASGGPDSSGTCRAPNGADIMAVYSTCNGMHSYRNTVTGSYFIQALCKELREHWETEELFSIMTAVTRRVIVDTQSVTLHHHSLCAEQQVPTIVSTLTGSVYFKQK